MAVPNTQEVLLVITLVDAPGCLWQTCPKVTGLHTGQCHKSMRRSSDQHISKPSPFHLPSSIFQTSLSFFVGFSAERVCSIVVGFRCPIKRLSWVYFGYQNKRQVSCHIAKPSIARQQGKSASSTRKVVPRQMGIWVSRNANPIPYTQGMGIISVCAGMLSHATPPPYHQPRSILLSLFVSIQGKSS